MLKPHPVSSDTFGSGALRKSFFTHSLNRSTRTWGGGSGYTSEARTKLVQPQIIGCIVPSKIVRTVLVTKTNRLAKPGYIANPFSIPFIYSVEYYDAAGKKMTIINRNIR